MPIPLLGWSAATPWLIFYAATALVSGIALGCIGHLIDSAIPEPSGRWRVARRYLARLTLDALVAAALTVGIIGLWLAL